MKLSFFFLLVAILCVRFRIEATDEEDDEEGTAENSFRFLNIQNLKKNIVEILFYL